MARTTTDIRTCRDCGCTVVRACAGGCYWVEADLCSACRYRPPDGMVRVFGVAVPLEPEWIVDGLDGVFEAIRAEAENFLSREGHSVTVRSFYMTREEFDSLPEL